MLIPGLAIWMSSVVIMVLGAGAASGQDFPKKPIRIVTVEAGGGTDFVARLIARGLTDNLGRPVIVDNRAGAEGIIAIEIVAKAPPDGYTMLVNSSGIWILPLVRDVPYDPVKDFSPITLTDRYPNILVVNPSVAVNSVKELIALAKARPGQLNCATGNAGTSNHLAAELFKAMASVNIVRVTYRGSGPALTALISGEVQLMFASVGSVAPLLKSGRLKALAVSGAQPSALAPDLPTIAASGLPGYESESSHSVYAPINTPRTLINRLNQEIVRVLNRADTRERFLKAGIEPVGSSPEQLAATMKSEMARMGMVIKNAGIRAD